MKFRITFYPPEGAQPIPIAYRDLELSEILKLEIPKGYKEKDIREIIISPL